MHGCDGRRLFRLAVEYEWVQAMSGLRKYCLKFRPGGK